MTKIRFAVVVVLAAMLAFVSPAGAQDEVLSIEVEGIVTGQAEGDIVEVASAAVPASLVGDTCTVSGASANNGSVHPGNNIIIASGGASTTVPGVEEVPGQVVSGSGSIVLGSDVTVSVEFGPSGSTSGGVTLDFDCADTAVAPVGGVATGAGGTAGGTSQPNLTLLALGAAALVGSGALLGLKRYSTFDA
jgi:hypothetical protein